MSGELPGSSPLFCVLPFLVLSFLPPCLFFAALILPTLPSPVIACPSASASVCPAALSAFSANEAGTLNKLTQHGHSGTLARTGTGLAVRVSESGKLLRTKEVRGILKAKNNIYSSTI